MCVLFIKKRWVIPSPDVFFLNNLRICVFEKDRGGGNNLHNWKVSRRIHWKICAYSSFLLFLYIAEQGEHLFNKYSLTFYREMDKKKKKKPHKVGIARWKIQNWERPNEGRYLISTPYAKIWWNLHICPSSKVASLVCPCHTKLQWKHFKIKSFNSIKLLFAIFFPSSIIIV